MLKEDKKHFLSCSYFNRIEYFLKEIFIIKTINMFITNLHLILLSYDLYTLVF